MSVLNPVAVRRLHRTNAIFLSVFIVTHVAVNLSAWGGAETHMAWQGIARQVYQNIVVETPLVIAILLQAMTGILSAKRRKRLDATSLSGLYLAFFMLVHSSAAIGTRLFQGLDTNYFWAAGSLAYGWVGVAFALYYGLAITSLFVHLQAAFSRGWPRTTKKQGRRPMASAVLGGLFAAILLLPYSPWLRAEALPETVRAYFDALYGWTGQIPDEAASLRPSSRSG